MSKDDIGLIYGDDGHTLVKKLMTEYGVELIDLKQDQSKRIKVEGEYIEVCQEVLEVDYLINVPVLKAHCQTKMTCALKNLKGCIPDSEKRSLPGCPPTTDKIIAYLKESI